MIDIGPLPQEIAAVDRVFADPFMARMNNKGAYWTSDHYLHSEEMLEAAKDWSASEQQLALLASALWGYRFSRGEDQFDVQQAAVVMSHFQLATALEAIAIRGRMAIDLGISPDPMNAYPDPFDI